MWHIEDIELAPVEMDFSESGQSRWSGHQALADTEQLVNAVELVDWTEEPVQVQVCEVCGITRCARGGHVSLRRAGEFVVFIPAFAAMLEDRAAREEFRPSDYLERRGAAVLSADAYEKLQSASSRPRPLETIESLAANEAVRVLQMEAPDRLLDEFPRDVAFSQRGMGQPELWSSHPMGLDEAVALFESTIAQWRDSTAPVSLESERDDADALVFGLDWPPTYEWKPLVLEANGAALRFEGGWTASRS